MGCTCIANGAQVKVTNIEAAGSTPIKEEISPKLQNIYTQLCWWAAPEYGDTGESWEKTLWKAALIAIATINSIAQMQIAQMRYEIARDYADIAKDRWKRFRDNYAPLERAMLNEVGNARSYDPDYPAARKRAYDNSLAAYLSADDQIADKAKRYGLCMDSTLLDDMNIAEALSLDDGTNYNYRMEEYWHYYVDDKNWNRRSQLLNLGRGIQAIAASYAQQANTALASLGDLVNQGAQGAMKLFGYLSTVRESIYPTMFSSAAPLSGQVSNLGSAIATGPMATQ